MTETTTQTNRATNDPVETDAVDPRTQPVEDQANASSVPAVASTAPPASTATTTPASTPAPASTGGTNGGSEAPLFDPAGAQDLQSRWQAIQVGFVDEPRGAVQQADQLVDEVMRRLQESFARERQDLERAWSGGDEASTEDLRQAIRRYRSFFNRLLAL